MVGSISNSGLVTGSVDGIALGSSSLSGNINNSGTIAGTSGDGVRLTASSMTGNINNSGLVSGSIAGIALATSAMTGNISNSGNITGQDGISLSGSLLSGNITNSGSIVGSAGTGIQLSTSTMVGSVVNTGLIRGTVAGIALDSSSLGGSIVNSSSGFITSTLGNAIQIINSTVNGNIANAGTISASVAGILIDPSTVTGDIINTGLLVGQYGVSVGGSLISGNVLNAGLIGGTVVGIDFSSSTLVGLISNTGTLVSSGVAINVDRTSTIVGGISNSGLIAGQTTAISNAGAILGTNAVAFQNGTVLGNISNVGTILGASTGVSINTSSMTGNIVNSASIGGGVAGVNLSTSTMSGTVVNTGTLSGGQVGLVATTSAITGGISNSGKISGSQYAINIDTISGSASGGIYVTGTVATIAGDVLAKSSTVSISGAGTNFTNSNAFDVKNLVIDSGATLNFLGTSTTSGVMPVGIRAGNGTGFVTNAGTLNVGMVTNTITGNLNNLPNGNYQVAVTNTGDAQHGRLNITGTLAGAGGSGTNLGTITADVSGRTYYGTGTKIVVAQANSIVGNFTSSSGIGGGINGAGMTLTGNTVTFAAGNNLSEAIRGNQVVLIVAGAENTYLQDTQQNNNTSAYGAAANLDNISNSNPNPGMQQVLNKLNYDGYVGGASKISQDISQTLPVIIGAASMETAQTIGVVNKIVQDRQDTKRGLSSGDGFIATKDFWIKGVGSFAKQGDINNVSGYSANTGGLALGVETELSPSSNLGAYFAFANSNISSNSSVAPSSIKANTYLVGAYGDYKLSNALNWNYQADVGVTNNNETRNINFMGWSANANYNSFNAHVGTGLKYVMPLDDKTRFIPSARIDYTSINSNGYSESGANALNLNVSSQTYNQLMTSVNLRLDRDIAEKLTVSANIGAGYNPLDNNVQITSAFQGGGSSFVTNGLSVSPWLYNAGIGITGQVAKDTTLNVRYDAQFSPTSYTNQVIGAKLRIGF